MSSPSQSSEHAHLHYMRAALAEAQKSPPGPTNFCVGAILVSPSSKEPVLATGYTLELPGNTHAEECCLRKYAERLGVTEEEVGGHLPEDTALYTTMEPCNKRLSGKRTCVERILLCRPRISTVYVGVQEPLKFVGVNEGQQRLADAGIKIVHVAGLEEEILRVAQAGHEK